MSRYQSNLESEDISQKINEEFNLSHIDIGPPIAKGCAAVVYAAALKKDAPVNNEQLKMTDVKTTKLPLTPRNEMMSPIQYTSRFIHNLAGGSVDNLSFNNRPNVDIEFVKTTNETNTETKLNIDKNGHGVKSVRFNTASNVVHSDGKESSSSTPSSSSSSDEEKSYVEVCLC